MFWVVDVVGGGEGLDGGMGKLGRVSRMCVWRGKSHKGIRRLLKTMDALTPLQSLTTVTENALVCKKEFEEDWEQLATTIAFSASV